MKPSQFRRFFTTAAIAAAVAVATTPDAAIAQGTGEFGGNQTTGMDDNGDQDWGWLGLLGLAGLLGLRRRDREHHTDTSRRV